MLTNFIYAQSKAMFEERLAEVPNDAIVFIEDTKEIWTHGTYFDCSTLDPNIIPNLQMEIDELKSKVVTPDWDVSDPASSAYINGRTHYSYNITQVAKFSIINKNVGDII
mgnify:CR=1 FL=1